MKGECVVSDRQDMGRSWISLLLRLVFAKAAVILIACQSRRLPLWNRREKQDTEHLALVLKRCGLRTNSDIIPLILFFFHVSKLQTAGKSQSQNLVHSVAWLRSFYQ